MTPAPLLDASDLEVHYGASRVLRGVSFRVMPGETVALLGRNGMGKTTLLRTLMGLVRPTQGRIVFGGDDVTGARASAVARRGLAFVPEDRGVFADLTVEESLGLAARAGADGRREWTLERIYALFPRLAERRRHRGDRISGGEQKMVAIGRALATNPRAILLDEATEGLAPLVRDDIWRTFAAIKAARVATVVVDKNLTELFALADRHVVLTKGEVVFDGTSAELTSDVGFIHRHLGV